MTRYLIDIRLMGPVKRQIHHLQARLQEKYGIDKDWVVPHITLAGPFSTDDEDRLIADFTRICSEQEGIPRFEVGGYGFFDATRVVYVAILPDEHLKRFRFRLAQAIAPYCSLREYDRDTADRFRFHATLAMKLGQLTYWRMKWFFRNHDPVAHRHHPVRATLLRNSRILCEYDFVQCRMLTAAQARGRATQMRDRDSLRAWEEGDGEHG